MILLPGPVPVFPPSTQRVIDRALERGWLEISGRQDKLESAWYASAVKRGVPPVIVQYATPPRLSCVRLDMIHFGTEVVDHYRASGAKSLESRCTAKNKASFVDCTTYLYAPFERIQAIAADVVRYAREAIQAADARWPAKGVFAAPDKLWRVTCACCDARLGTLMFDRAEARDYVLRQGWSLTSGAQKPEWRCAKCSAMKIGNTELPGRPIGTQGRLLILSMDEVADYTERRRLGESMRPFVRLYKDGNVLAVQTNCGTEESFVGHFNRALASLIEENRYESDWEFQLDRWIPQAFEILAKLRGYKSDVHEERVITAGGTTPSALDLVVDTSESATLPKLAQQTSAVGSGDDTNESAS